MENQMNLAFDPNILLPRGKQIRGMPSFGQLSIIGRSNIRAIIDEVQQCEFHHTHEVTETHDIPVYEGGTTTVFEMLQTMFVASLAQLESEYEKAIEKPMFPNLRSGTHFVGQDLVIIDVENRHGRREHPNYMYVKAKFSQLRKYPPGFIEYTPLVRGDNTQESYLIRPDSPEILLKDEYTFFLNYLTCRDKTYEDKMFYNIWKIN